MNNFQRLEKKSMIIAAFCFPILNVKSNPFGLLKFTNCFVYSILVLTTLVADFDGKLISFGQFHKRHSTASGLKTCVGVENQIRVAFRRLG